MLTQYPARDTAAPQPRQLPQALRAVLDALVIADEKKLRKQEHQDQRDGAFVGGRPDTDESIAVFAAEQTATLCTGMTFDANENYSGVFVPRPRVSQKRKQEGRSAIPATCLWTEMIDTARVAEGKKPVYATPKPRKRKRKNAQTLIGTYIRRALHQ